MYWRTPDVRQVTDENTFVNEENSIYSFISNSIGKNYNELADFATVYFNKEENQRYFGQIISYINFLGLLELDFSEDAIGLVVENELLEDIFQRVNNENELILFEYVAVSLT